MKKKQKRRLRRIHLRLSEKAVKILTQLSKFDDLRIPYRAVISLLLGGTHPAEIKRLPKGVFNAINKLISFKVAVDSVKKGTEMPINISPEDFESVDKLRRIFFELDFEKPGDAVYLTRNKAINRLLELAEDENNEEFKEVKIGLEK